MTSQALIRGAAILFLAVIAVLFILALYRGPSGPVFSDDHDMTQLCGDLDGPVCPTEP